MTVTPAPDSPNGGTDPSPGRGSPREHSETAAEGTDGQEMPEIREHSQDAAEGPADDS